MLVVFFAGIGVGVAVAVVAGMWASRYDSTTNRAPRAELPPATARKLARSARHNRLDLSPAFSAEHARRYISPPDGDFDREDTHG